MLWCYFDANTPWGSARLLGMTVALRELSNPLVETLEPQKSWGEGIWCPLNSHLVSDTVLNPLPGGAMLEPEKNLLDSVWLTLSHLWRGVQGSEKEVAIPPFHDPTLPLPSQPPFIANFSRCPCHLSLPLLEARGGHLLYWKKPWGWNGHLGLTVMLSDLGEPHFHRPPFPGLSINPSLSSLHKLVIGSLLFRELLERMLLSERNAPGHSASSGRKLLGSGGAFLPTCRSLVCEDMSECASLSCRFRLPLPSKSDSSQFSPVIHT